MGPRPLREVGRSNGEGQVGHAGALNEPSARSRHRSEECFTPSTDKLCQKRVSFMSSQWLVMLNTVSQGRAENSARLYAYIGKTGTCSRLFMRLTDRQIFHRGGWRDFCGNSVRRIQRTVEERDLRYGRHDQRAVTAGTAERRAEHDLACGTTLALELHLTTSTSVTTWHYPHGGVSPSLSTSIGFCHFGLHLLLCPKSGSRDMSTLKGESQHELGRTSVDVRHAMHSLAWLALRST